MFVLLRVKALLRLSAAHSGKQEYNYISAIRFNSSTSSERGWLRKKDDRCPVQEKSTGKVRARLENLRSPDGSPAFLWKIHPSDLQQARRDEWFVALLLGAPGSIITIIVLVRCVTVLKVSVSTKVNRPEVNYAFENVLESFKISLCECKLKERSWALRGWAWALFHAKMFDLSIWSDLQKQTKIFTLLENGIWVKMRG